MKTAAKRNRGKGYFLKTLARRRDYLAELLAEQGCERRPGASYDMAEHAALKWALPILTEHLREEEQGGR